MTEHVGYAKMNLSPYFEKQKRSFCNSCLRAGGGHLALE